VGEWTGNLLVKSFMTVDTDFKGRGVGRELRRRIAQEIARRQEAALRFGAQVPSADRVLAEDYAAAGLHIRRMGPCLAAAAMVRGGMPEPAIEVEEFAALWRTRASNGVVDPFPSLAELAHYLEDPRRRSIIGVRASNGVLVAAAMVVRAAVATKRGVEEHVQLEQVFADRNAGAEHLARLVAGAAYWGYETRSGVVTIPNTGDTPWSQLAEAGFRKLPPRYSAWIATTATSHPLHAAGATNLEIV
jgi:hypothetical protein